MPGDVDFECSVYFFVNDILVTGKVQETMVVTEDCFGVGIENGDGGFGHRFLTRMNSNVKQMSTNGRGGVLFELIRL